MLLSERPKVRHKQRRVLKALQYYYRVGKVFNRGEYKYKITYVGKHPDPKMNRFLQVRFKLMNKLSFEHILYQINYRASLRYQIIDEISSTVLRVCHHKIYVDSD
jgi:hypothetical protein